MTGKVIGWVAFAILTALYGYMVVAAVGNLALFPEMANQLGLSVNEAGWFWLWLGVALPVLAFGGAVLVGRRRKGGERLLVLATALAVVAALQLEIGLLVPPISFFV